MREYKVIFAILTKGERLRFVQLCCLASLLGIIEAAGVLSILPFVSVAVDPASIDQLGPLRTVLETFGINTDSGRVMALGAVSFAVLMIGVAARGWTIWAQTRFGRHLAVRLATRLLESYLTRPYEWFLTRHTAELGGRVITETEQAVRGAVLAGLQFASSAAVAACITAALALANPGAALTMGGVLGGTYLVVFLIARHRLSRLGENRQGLNAMRHRNAAEALIGIRQIKTLGAEAHARDRFAVPANRLADTRAEAEIIAQMPRQALEVAVLGSMIALVLFAANHGASGLQSALPILGLYAVSAVRLLPVLNRLFNAGAGMRFSQSGLSSLKDELTGPPAAEQQPRPLPFDNQITLEGVSYTYPTANTKAIDRVSLTINAGEIIAIVGPTGSGKSTLVDLILGLISPTEGRILIDGAPLDTQTDAWRATIGYVPQDVVLLGDTLAEAVTFGAPRDDTRLKSALEAACIDDLPGGFDALVGERGLGLSGGQRQRVGIARAIYRQRPVLVLDEPTSALDAEMRDRLTQSLWSRDTRRTVIIVTHDEALLPLCDRVFQVENGQVRPYCAAPPATAQAI